MWFEQIVRKETGCASYVIGSMDTGECAVYDPLWDPQPFLDIAKKYKSTIRYVIDSHSHADHVSGAPPADRRRPARSSSCRSWRITVYEATRVHDGDRLDLGEVTLEIVHTPGHRPEQIYLVVIDHSRGEDPWCLLTADFLLVGDVARPDLAQGGEEGAKVIFDSPSRRLRELPALRGGLPRPRRRVDVRPRHQWQGCHYGRLRKALQRRAAVRRSRRVRRLHESGSTGAAGEYPQHRRHQPGQAPLTMDDAHRGGALAARSQGLIEKATWWWISVNRPASAAAISRARTTCS